MLCHTLYGHTEEMLIEMQEPIRLVGQTDGSLGLARSLIDSLSLITPEQRE